MRWGMSVCVKCMYPVVLLSHRGTPSISVHTRTYTKRFFSSLHVAHSQSHPLHLRAVSSHGSHKRTSTRVLSHLSFKRTRIPTHIHPRASTHVVYVPDADIWGLSWYGRHWTSMCSEGNFAAATSRLRLPTQHHGHTVRRVEKKTNTPTVCEMEMHLCLR